MGLKLITKSCRISCLDCRNITNPLMKFYDANDFTNYRVDWNDSPILNTEITMSIYIYLTILYYTLQHLLKAIVPTKRPFKGHKNALRVTKSKSWLYVNKI